MSVNVTPAELARAIEAYGIHKMAEEADAGVSALDHAEVLLVECITVRLRREREESAQEKPQEPEPEEKRWPSWAVTDNTTGGIVRGGMDEQRAASLARGMNLMSARTAVGRYGIRETSRLDHRMDCPVICHAVSPQQYVCSCFRQEAQEKKTCDAIGRPRRHGNGELCQCDDT